MAESQLVISHKNIVDIQRSFAIFLAVDRNCGSKRCGRYCKSSGDRFGRGELKIANIIVAHRNHLHTVSVLLTLTFHLIFTRLQDTRPSALSLEVAIEIDVCIHINKECNCREVGPKLHFHVCYGGLSSQVEFATCNMIVCRHYPIGILVVVNSCSNRASRVGYTQQHPLGSRFCLLYKHLGIINRGRQCKLHVTGILTLRLIGLSLIQLNLLNECLRLVVKGYSTLRNLMIGGYHAICIDTILQCCHYRPVGINCAQHLILGILL